MLVEPAEEPLDRSVLAEVPLFSDSAAPSVPVGSGFDPPAGLMLRSGTGIARGILSEMERGNRVSRLPWSMRETESPDQNAATQGRTAAGSLTCVIREFQSLTLMERL